MFLVKTALIYHLCYGSALVSPCFMCTHESQMDRTASVTTDKLFKKKTWVAKWLAEAVVAVCRLKQLIF